MSAAQLYRGPWRAIVVGGGHAGCEAALACARSGVETLLITQNVDRIGWMSCNPSIGGVGKSHLVAEIDALGGEMAVAADASSVQSKWLNDSRGPAVRALRAQCDKLAYATAIRQTIEAQAHLHVKQGDVARLRLDHGRLAGVETSNGLAFEAEVVILTAGTFLDAVLHTGQQVQAGGRAGDAPSRGLGAQMRDLGVATLRHKTGTCPRIDGRSIDYAQLQPDPGMEPPPRMSVRSQGIVQRQMPCHIAYTTAATHQIIRDNLDRSPMFTGAIEGRGPRYCPSIEDKVVRFSHHDRHYLFLEREGWQTQEVYVSGLSTSLPADVQIQMVRSIAGLEQAEIVRFGYAVEYDAIDARQLGRDLMLPHLPGLFLAGQVNGTSGYEEAAAQGLIAGVNAVARLRGLAPVVFGRDQAYLGVLVDDLVTQGNAEPYRMFTSRAEHRLELRCSNADLRLTALGRALGLVGDRQWQVAQARLARLERARQVLAETTVRPTREEMPLVEAIGAGTLVTTATLKQIACRSGAEWHHLDPWLPEALRSGPNGELTDADQTELLTEARYAGYIERETRRLERTNRHDQWLIPLDLDYSQVGGLSAEAVEKLQRVRPETLGQAGRVPGVTPAAVQAIAFVLRALQRRRGSSTATPAAPADEDASDSADL